MAEPNPMETLSASASGIASIDPDYTPSTNRWWTNNIQKAFLLARRDEYYVASAGGKYEVTLFNRRVAADFLKRFNALKLVQQFKEEHRLHEELLSKKKKKRKRRKIKILEWDETCPSLHGNTVPSSNLRNSETMVDAIRRRLNDFFTNHNEIRRPVVTKDLCTFGFSKDTNTRAHTPLEIFSHDHYHTLIDPKYRAPLAILERTKAITAALEAAEEDLASLTTDEAVIRMAGILGVSLDDHQRPAVILTVLEERASLLHLDYVKPCPLDITRAATNSAWHDLTDLQRAEYNERALQSKEESAAKKKKTPSTTQAELTDEHLVENIRTRPVYIDNFFQHLVKGTGHIYTVLMTGPNGEGGMTTDIATFGRTNPCGQNFMESYGEFISNVREPFRAYGLSCYGPHEIQSKNIHDKTSTSKSAAGTTTPSSTTPVLPTVPAIPILSDTASIPVVPAVSATSTSPAASTTSTPPAVSATSTSPAVSATSTSPAVSATFTSPDVSVISISPAVPATPIVAVESTNPVQNATPAVISITTPPIQNTSFVGADASAVDINVGSLFYSFSPDADFFTDNLATGGTSLDHDSGWHESPSFLEDGHELPQSDLSSTSGWTTDQTLNWTAALPQSDPSIPQGTYDWSSAETWAGCQTATDWVVPQDQPPAAPTSNLSDWTIPQDQPPAVSMPQMSAPPLDSSDWSHLPSTGSIAQMSDVIQFLTKRNMPCTISNYQLVCDLITHGIPSPHHSQAATPIPAPVAIPLPIPVKSAAVLPPSQARPLSAQLLELDETFFSQLSDVPHPLSSTASPPPAQDVRSFPSIGTHIERPTPSHTAHTVVPTAPSTVPFGANQPGVPLRKGKRKLSSNAALQPRKKSKSNSGTQSVDDPPAPDTRRQSRRAATLNLAAAHKENIPPSIISSLDGMRAVMMGDDWDRTVLTLRHLEGKISVEDPHYQRRLIISAQRPSELVVWMNAGYNFETPVVLRPAAAKLYASKWLQWWNGVQPIIRRREAGSLLPPAQYDGFALRSLRCGGPCGLITLLLGLFHWGRSGHELDLWHEAFADFSACVGALDLVSEQV